jgi:signal transduction histidine kinase
MVETMENTTLEDRLRALIESSAALSSDLDLDVLLQRLIEIATRMTGARYAALGVLNEARSGLALFYTHGLDRDRALKEIGHLPAGHGLLGALIADPRPLRLDDLQQDPRSSGFPAGHPPMTNFLGVPVLVRGRVYGNLYLTEKAGGFTADDEELVSLLAGQAGIAIELSQRVARDSLRRVLQGQELERRRLARELHDETGQALTSILLGLKEVESSPDAAAVRAATQRLRELVVETLQDVRALAVELRPRALDDFGLTAALERLAEIFSQKSGLTVDVVAALGPARLPEEVETTLYRIAQEALTNVVKHSGAASASLVLRRRRDRVFLLVEDDGGGIQGEPRADAIGLVGMRERTALLGGQLRLESSANGTTVSVEVPVPPLAEGLS